MTRYSLEEVFGSEEKKLGSFKSRKVTKTKFYCYINNLIVLEDEETVIGVLSSGSNDQYSLIIHYNNWYFWLINLDI